MYTIEHWLEEDEVKGIEYNQYWNDEDAEIPKEWYILDGNFNKMEMYLKKVELPQSLEKCISLLKSKFNIELEGNGMDIAAGNCWSAQLLLKDNVNLVYFLEYSFHRLLKLGPCILKHYGIAKEKVVLAFGSFYNINLPESSLDFILMAQAFHHAEYPERLLAEARRVLKNNKPIMIIGEHRIDGPTAPPPDNTLGDHYYTLDEYNALFSAHGFTWEIVERGSSFQSFVLLNNK